MAIAPKLRFWGLCQYVYETFTHPRTEDREDFAAARRNLFRRVVLGGHLDDRCFVSMDGDFPELRKPSVLEQRAVVVRIAIEHLGRYLRQGLRKSGIMPGYLRAQRAHLETCEPCKIMVHVAVREDVDLGENVRTILSPLRVLRGGKANGAAN